MQSSTTRASFSVDEDLLDDLDAIAEAEDKSRSEKLRELVEREVGHRTADDGGGGEYLPENDLYRDVYLAAVEHAKKPGFVLRLDVFRSEVAQDAGVSTDTFENVLFLLQGAGYVRRKVGSPGVERSLDAWKVKPKCADPAKWKHRKKA